MTDDPRAMANTFANRFSSVFNNCLNFDGAYPHQECEEHIDQLVITTKDVESFLADLDPNSSMGEDGLHPRLLRALSSSLAIPFCILFNNSLNCGVLPKLWLNSIVVPIYKKGSRYDALNYRPISITSVPCKSLERIIVRHILDYLNMKNILSDNQFGFRSGYSTTD